MGEPWRGEVSFVSAEALVNSRVDGLLQRIIYIYILYIHIIWLVVWNIWIIFPCSWEVHHPNCYSLIFFKVKMVDIPPTSIYILYDTTWLNGDHELSVTKLAIGLGFPVFNQYFMRRDLVIFECSPKSTEAIAVAAMVLSETLIFSPLF